MIDSEQNNAKKSGKSEKENPILEGIPFITTRWYRHCWYVTPDPDRCKQATLITQKDELEG